METQQMKIRISLTTREVEFDGDLALIKENFGEHIEDYLKAIKKEVASTSTEKKHYSHHPEPKIDVAPPSYDTSFVIPDNFGEFYSKFPKGLSNVDKMLLASYFVQNSSEGKCFTVKEASDLLIEQGVSLSNPGVFNKHNISSKRIFKLSGKNFRVSDTGVDYIKSLTQNQK
jgi:hypothetical protein